MRTLWFLLLFSLTQPLLATTLVSDATIDLQKKKTQIHKLKNGLTLLYRQIENTELSTLSVTYPFGLKDLEGSDKSYLSALFSVMPDATKTYNKEAMFKITERYSSGVGCQSGIDSSSCSLGVVNDYWQDMLPVFKSVLEEPTLDQSDLDNYSQKRRGELEQNLVEPSAVVNQVVNEVYYPPNHPYYLSWQDEISDLKKVKSADLKGLYTRVAGVKGQYFTYVGSLTLKEVTKTLEKSFPKVTVKPGALKSVKQPSFDPKKSLSFSDKKIPTAYLILKYNLPGPGGKDEAAVRLMLRILSEELGLEIRTKRSLSYGTYAYSIDNAIGIGVISASTSKPKETLTAMTEVIDRFKKKVYSKKELDRYRMIYTTQFYLTHEAHTQLAGALSDAYFKYGSTDPFYDAPKKLGEVTGKEVQRAAKDYLKNFRLGMVFDMKEFDQKVAEAFIKHHAS